jgi:hypothetical protein
MIGEVEVDPESRVRLLEAKPTEHRLALDRGTLHARIWAPPRLFFVNTPSAVAVDLGCRYTLTVDASGASLLHVTYGWVAFEFAGRESFVPANAMAETQPGHGPGTPFFEDVSPEFRKALALFDFGTLGNAAAMSPEGERVQTPAEVHSAALQTILNEARPKDALTLWHMLSRTSGADREKVYARLAQFVPPPDGVTREAVLRGERQALDRWWDALGLGDTSWWRMWKGPVPVR